MHLYQPMIEPPRKWCGCALYVWCNHTLTGPPYFQPATTATKFVYERPDDGYVGKHRKPEE